MARAAPIELTIPESCAGLRLDQALVRLLPDHSRSRLARWMRGGLVHMGEANVVPRQKVWGGEHIRIMPMAEPGMAMPQAETIPLDIVFEDDALLVVNKPAGLVVHPGSGNWSGTLLNALLAHVPRLADLPRAGIVHRLDKDTSGLLVVAKTLVAHTHLVRQLQARRITRIYVAVAHGILARSERIEAPIGRHPTRRTRMAVIARGKPAVTHCESIERLDHATVLRCRLESGRTHQIRVHLQSIGHPLIGDPAYGARRNAGVPQFHRQALHAERLELAHPVTGAWLSWQASLPSDMTQLIAALRRHT